MRLKVSRKLLFLLLALIAIGLFIFFFASQNMEPGISPEETTEEMEKDKIPPSTAIISPQDKSWHNKDFWVEINDSDLGSGLIDYKAGESGCKYIIEDLGTGESAGDFRKCDPVEVWVPVGQGKVCSSSYRKEDISQGKCKVSSLSTDKAGNDSGWKSKVFNVDLINPEVGRIVLNQNSFELDKDYIFEASASDNSQITGCWFYLDGKNSEKKVEVNPIPCKDGMECRIYLTYSFNREGDYNISFVCSDIVGNLGAGEKQIVKVTQNHPPQISSCQVLSGQGKVEDEFQFRVEAADPEQDLLFFLWDFGDGKTSEEQNPKHQYSTTGTFEPKVLVSDDKGESSECQTAWVVVSES